MSSAFPLVRASAIGPLVQWMQRTGRPLGEVLAACEMSTLPSDEPDRPIPVSAAFSVFRLLAEREGPDIGFVVGVASSLADLGSIGSVMLGAKTPRDALTRVAAAMERHSTHERIALAPAAGGLEVREWVDLNVDATARHAEQQYVVALLRGLCLATGFDGEPLGRVEIAPHPQWGVAHLQGRLGVETLASPSRTLSLFMPDAVLDLPLPPTVSIGAIAPGADWTKLRGADGYVGTLRLLLDAMIDEGAPTVHGVAAASGLSLRSFQRRLAQQGTNFSAVLDDVRRTRALGELSERTPMATIASSLGYARPSSFTRATRRWIGLAPSDARDAKRNAT